LKTLLFICAAALLSGCALTHDQVIARAKEKSNTELCMASIQFPQYGDVIAAELAERKHSCDWDLANAQVQAQAASNAQRAAAIQSAAASFNLQPMKTTLPSQLAPTSTPTLSQAQSFTSTGATAYFTGQQRQVQTVTNQIGWNCEYRYLTQTFWRTFVGMCPQSVQVQ
jgi:DNA-binding NtrC family response regulator